MFTTLPLELFVCREVRALFDRVTGGLNDGQVIEQYFFSHEGFNPQRHVFFTSSILCASMLRTSSLHIRRESALDVDLSSFPHHV